MEAVEPKPHQEALLNRLNSFSDGIFAFAITLLVIDLRLPAGLSGSIVPAVRQLLPHFFAVLLSFYVIGSYWMRNSLFYSHFRPNIPNPNRTLLGLNLAFLFCIVILPFPTSLVSFYSGQTISVVLYAINLSLAGFLQFIAWYYAIRENREQIAETRKEVKNYIINALMLPLVFLVSIPIAFIKPSLAEAFWLLSILAWYQFRRRHLSQ